MYSKLTGEYGKSAEKCPRKALVPQFAAKFSSAIVLTSMILMATVLLDVIGIGRLSRTAHEAMIMMIIVLGLNTFVGNSGILSFGHVVFAAIGAYSTAWMTCCPTLKPILLPGLPVILQNAEIPIWLSVIVSVVAAMAIAFVIGWVILRLSGFAAAISTFALLGIFNTIFSNWESVTAGTGSIAGIPAISNVWIFAAAVILVLWIAFAYKVSRHGLALRASRDDEVAAKASGINILKHRVFAFVLSAGIVAFGGALQAHHQGVITVEIYYLDLTLMSLAMLVIGGRQSLSGSIIGVSIVYVLIEILRRLEEGIVIGGEEFTMVPGTQEFLLGIILIAVLLFRSEGILGNSELIKIRHRKEPA